MLIPSVPWQAYHHKVSFCGMKKVTAITLWQFQDLLLLKHGTIAHTGSLSCFFLDCFVIGSITSMLFVGLFHSVENLHCN